MSAPTMGDAKRRALVVLEDGRTGRLQFVSRSGRTAKVEVRPGVWLSVPAASVAVAAEPSPAREEPQRPPVGTPCDVCQSEPALVTVGCVDYCAGCAIELGIGWR